jgi:hypothetical protein
MKPKRDREAPELAAAAIRMMRALARRAGEGELEALEALATLTDSAAMQLGAAVAGYREGPAEASWTDIGRALGMSRQSAHERWSQATVAPAWPASSCTCERDKCNPLKCHHCAAVSDPSWCPQATMGLVQS